MIPGSSIVATRIRERDWRDHALGPVESWPAALRCALTTCLTSRTPTQIWWGVSGILFFNDAYIPWLAEHGEDALGRRAADVYGAQWNVVRSAVQHVFVEAAVVEAGGFILTPLLGGDGVEGIVCTRAADQIGDDVLMSLYGEVRQPLSALFQPDASDPSGTLRTHVEHALRAVDALVDLTRLGHGRLALERERVDLGAVIADAITLLGIDVDTEIRADVQVEVDRRRMTRVFCRLLSHASRDGSRIKLVVEQGGGANVTIEAPAGCNWMAPSIQSARNIIALHLGTLECGASSVRVHLPLARATEIAPVTLDPYRVLVVEDDDTTARTTQMLLEDLGYKVAVAHDGAVAVELARMFRPDVALIDLRLPVIDGWEVARRIRERIGNIPVVGVTGMTDEESRSRSRQAGFVDHFCKPFDVDVLQRCLSSIRARAPS